MMKDQQPDKLFREKLAGYQKPVSANAWDRVESAMERKAFPWMRVAAAASLLVVCGVAAALWLRNDASTVNVASNDQPKLGQSDNSTDPVIHEATDETKSFIQDSVEANQAHEIPMTNKVTSPSESPRQKNTPETPSHQKRVEAIHDSPALASHDEPGSGLVGNESPDINEETLRSNNERLLASNEMARPGHDGVGSVTIVISAEETRAYLTKNVNTEATREEKKTSTLKKVLKKASELKSNDQDPIGDLRQMKDEVLALNFKSNKRGQNK